jgi:hypothetical protein
MKQMESAGVLQAQQNGGGAGSQQP